VFNASLITLPDQATINRFTSFVNMPTNYTFWTFGHYSQLYHDWVWAHNNLLDTSLFCPDDRYDYVLENYAYYDGSGCLRSDNSTVTRYLALVSDNYVIPTNWAGLTQDYEDYDNESKV